MVNELIQNARAFYPRDSDDPLVEEIVRELARDILLGSYQKQIKHLKYLLLDLRHRQIESPHGWIFCSRDKNSYLHYQALEPFKSLGVSVDPFISVLRKLASSGMIDLKNGFMDEASFMTRIRPTDELLPYLNKISEELVRNSVGAAQEIVLRKKEIKSIKGRPVTRKLPIPFDETDETRAMAGEIRFFNRRFSRFHIDIINPYEPQFESAVGDGIKQTEININLNRKYIHRVFNDDFENGGRFYGAWWQNIPSKLRQYILIDGIPTVEVDFKGFHIALLYSIQGIDYFAQEEDLDPYRVEGWERDDVKLLLQIVLNTPKKNVIKAYNDTRIEEGLEPIPKGELQVLISKFEEIHSPIVPYFYEGWGILLQNIDAKIASNVMKSCMHIGAVNEYGVGHKFPALPVHDSFIVQKEFKDMLIQFMKTAVSEVITELEFFEGKKLEQYKPKVSYTNPINPMEMPTDIALMSRKSMYEKGETLPELKFLRRSNKDGGINLFKIDPDYNI